jgi:hypothetical protein
MINAFPDNDLHHIHDNALENHVTVITDTKEDEMVKMEVGNQVMLFSPIEEAKQVWKHHGADRWSPLRDFMQTPISSN